MMKRYIVIPICVLFLLWSQGAMAQQRMGTIYGTLQNNTGKPVAGATITLSENPDIQAVTNDNGSFTINGRVGQHLTISSSDHPVKEVSIRQDTMKIQFATNQTIPIGFGISRSKTGITSAVGVVRAKDLPINSSFIRTGNMLVGKIPGLTTLQAPGITYSSLLNNRYSPTKPIFFIRGIGTFSTDDNHILSNSSPLIIVDGFQSTINSVIPESVQSITILKDAAAQALYGQRGANGVIVIKTNRGADAPLQVHASYTQSLTKPANFPPHFVNGLTYARALNEARGNDGLPLKYNQYDIHGYDTGASPYFYPNVNWFNKVLRDHGVRANVNMDFTGGGESIRYYTMLHFMHNNGLFGPVHENNGYDQQYIYAQFNFLTNLDIDLTNTTLLKLNISARLTRVNRPRGLINNIFNSLYSIPSGAFPVKTPDGNWGGAQNYESNPVADLVGRGYNIPNLREVSIAGKLKQKLDKLLKGLSAEVDVNYHNYGNYFQQHYATYQYEIIDPVRDPNGAIVDTSSSIFGTNTELSYYTFFRNLVRQGNLRGKLNYQKTFGNNNISAMLMYEQERYTGKGLNAELHYRNMDLNVHYGFKNTYFLAATAVVSGRNNLPEGNRYHFFPAVSAAWMLSNEDFMENINFINYLKLRASVGISGNNQVPLDNPYDANYNTDGENYIFTDNQGTYTAYYESQLPSSDIGVERSHQVNVGIDTRLFTHLSISADVFYAHRTDILTNSGGIYSSVIGIETPLRSDGVVNNRGLDASLKWQQNFKNFGWYIGGKVSWTQNEIINEDEKFRPYDYLKRTGKEVGQEFGLKAIGFFKDQQDIANSPHQEFSPVEPGDIKYKDINHDGVIDQYDEIPLGYHSGYPNLYYSGTIGVCFKGISISAFLQGVGQMTAYLNTPSVYWPMINNTTVSKYYYQRRWTPQTAATATYPRLTSQSNQNNFRKNSIWLVNGSFLKLRNVKVSYTLPQTIANQLHMDEITITASGRNLASWDHIPVGDPENYGTGYPLLRYYSLGLNITF